MNKLTLKLLDFIFDYSNKTLAIHQTDTAKAILIASAASKFTIDALHRQLAIKTQQPLNEAQMQILLKNLVIELQVNGYHARSDEFGIEFKKKKVVRWWRK